MSTVVPSVIYLVKLTKVRHLRLIGHNFKLDLKILSHLYNLRIYLQFIRLYDPLLFLGTTITNTKTLA